MKKVLFIRLFLIALSANAQQKNITSKVLENSIDAVYNIFIKTEDNHEMELVKNYYPLIDEEGYLVENKYFGVEILKNIKEKHLDKKMFSDKKNTNKIFNLLNKNTIRTIRITSRLVDNKYYIFYETIWITKTKQKSIKYSYYNTIALLIYNYNQITKDYSLEKIITELQK